MRIIAVFTEGGGCTKVQGRAVFGVKIVEVVMEEARLVRRYECVVFVPNANVVSSSLRSSSDLTFRRVVP